MRWIKKGVIFCPEGNDDWMVSHASYPFTEPLGESFFRVYFSSRDKNNRSSIGFFEFDLHHPKEILRTSTQPVIGPGESGLFDDSGASMGCLVLTEGKKYLYYLGWNLGVSVPWRNSIGLAIGHSDEAVFMKYSKAPIVDRNDVDPFTISYPWVMTDGLVWKMWYGSHLSWGTGEADMTHVIKYAESEDGIQWQRNGVICIDLKKEEEHAVSRPTVLKIGGMYRMWYSCQARTYRIGYAESRNGIDWIRKDEEVGIDVSVSGWDSEMIEYPCVFEYKGQLYMLYNGNGYGKTGIGLAMLEG